VSASTFGSNSQGKNQKKYNCIAVASPSFSKSPELVSELKELCVQLVLNDQQHKFTEDTLVAWLNETQADGCVIGTDPVSQKVVSRLKFLKAIGKYGVGCDNIDQNALKDKGIFFGWEGGVNRRSVSELALCFMLGHFRNVLRSVDAMQRGQWVKHGGVQLSDRKVGIVGLGFIGSDIANLLKPFGCEVSYCDVVDKSAVESGLGIKRRSYEELLQWSDAITFHVPQDQSTIWMFGEKEIAQCRPDTLIVNTARGKIVDFKAVTAAVRAKRLAGYASDVFPDEPLADAQSFKVEHGFYFTPHIGGNAYEAVLNMGRAAIRGLQQAPL
jgi:phosphoglycerate dehydrogenase-like enzyme